MQREHRVRLLVFFGSLTVATTCPAPILNFDKLTIDFTSEKDAQSKAEWSIPDGKIDNNGIGCEQKMYSRSWIETKPLPIGLSWRPTSGAEITVKISPPPLKAVTPTEGEQKKLSRWRCVRSLQP